MKAINALSRIMNTAASIVLADIAEQTIVGAGSIVTKPAGPRVIVAGNPARPLGDRTEPRSLTPKSSDDSK